VKAISDFKAQFLREAIQDLVLRTIWPGSLCSRGGHGSGVPESAPAGFCAFLSDPESKICEKTDSDPESLFNFGSSRSLCGHFLSVNM